MPRPQHGADRAGNGQTDGQHRHDDQRTNHELVVTLEDGILDGGFGEKIARFYGADKMKVLNFGLAKKFYDRYDYETLAKENHLTAVQVAADILANL